MPTPFDLTDVTTTEAEELHEDLLEERDGWEDERDDGRLRDRCVLGAECCCPHVFHGPDECFTAEMAEAFFAPEIGGEHG